LLYYVDAPLGAALAIAFWVVVSARLARMSVTVTADEVLVRNFFSRRVLPVHEIEAVTKCDPWFIYPFARSGDSDLFVRLQLSSGLACHPIALIRFVDREDHLERVRALLGTYRRVTAVYRMSFSEPWDLNNHDLRIEIDAPPLPAQWPVYGRVVTCDWDGSLVGRAAQVERRHEGDDTPLNRFPIVSVSIEASDAESSWRGLGFGKLTLLREERCWIPRRWPST
jgi:hypothetical protein